MTIEQILAQLLSFRAVAGSPNIGIAEWTAGYLRECGASTTLIPSQDESHFNVFATFGPRDVPGLVLSGHLDVVPAGETGWRSDPFVLTAKDDLLFGRGSTDMQGFIACVLALANELVACSKTRPIHVALSCDEELGCRGVPSLLRALPQLCTLPAGAVIGEPTGLVPVCGHKGKAAYRLTVQGTPGHSSRPDLGLNAIHGLSAVLSRIVGEEKKLSAGPFAEAFEPPFSTMQCGIIGGGQAINIIAGEAALEVEVRAIPGIDPVQLLSPVLACCESLTEAGYQTNCECLANYPAMKIDTDAPLVTAVVNSAGRAAIDAVSFGTEAGLFQKAGIPSIVCGPGDINRAHKPNEYIARNELKACCRFLRTLVHTFDYPASSASR